MLKLISVASEYGAGSECNNNIEFQHSHLKNGVKCKIFAARIIMNAIVNA